MYMMEDKSAFSKKQLVCKKQDMPLKLKAVIIQNNLISDDKEV